MKYYGAFINNIYLFLILKSWKLNKVSDLIFKKTMGESPYSNSSFYNISHSENIKKN
jgi:hypothetical protein